MNENRFAAIISYLFAEDRKKYAIAPSKVRKILADLLEGSEKIYEKQKETKNEQQKDRRTGEKSPRG